MYQDLQISLEDIAKQLKEDDSKYSTIQEVLDEIYGVGLSAVNITSLLSGGFTVPDLFKDFKPSMFINKFMPKKYIHVSKEGHALAKYEKLSINNILIILASYNQALLEETENIEKIIKRSMIEDPKQNIKERTKDINKQLIEDKTDINKLQCLLPNKNNHSTSDFIESLLSIQMDIFNIWLHRIDNEKLIKRIKQLTLKYYYINLLEISSEFPEVKLWIDLEFQKEMLLSHAWLKKTLDEIREYQANIFSNQFGLKEMDNLLSKNSNTQLQSLKDLLDVTTLGYIDAHHKSIQDTVNEKLLEENDIEKLVLPKRVEIYIPQSYKYFYYKENIHKKNYLVSNNWSNIDYREGEDIGKELFHALRNPYNINQPIIMLGHPGAGKSMFSSQFAYKLINNNEFVPFLIKLRNVDSSITDIDEHINKGIQNTVAGKPDINWVDWAKKFPDKIPVIILDGFDELLRASQTQLNDYILKIQKLQKTVQNLNLNIRVILTSRLTIMQDVKIPEDSLVIKLNSFDQKRKNLWIEKWNEKQLDDKQFNLPKRDDINELSQEPLLLFLLALYDFENHALSKIAEEGLNKSSLYDRLFVEFTKRQLRKNSSYNSGNNTTQEKMEELFRLRIGFFASMLFLHDRVHHLEKDFDEELEVFGLCDKSNKAKNILDGFFFVHKDKSTDGHDTESLSFEFLHKTFGEFLSADFMLRIAKFKAEDDEEISYLFNEKYFRQVFSYQWIYKQPKILDFLLEHSESIIDIGSYRQLVKFIKKELKTLVDESITIISPVALHQLKTFEKLKHIAIYSQNLVLLWISLENDPFEFDLSKSINNIQSWKVFVDLWKNYGGYEFVSYLSEYIDVNIDDSKSIIIKKQTSKRNGNYTEYSDYTHIANNYYETVLSYYESDFTLGDLSKLYNVKDENLSSNIANLTITRLDYLYSIDKNSFDNNIFWSLWKTISFANKIKLFDFFSLKGIPFDNRRASRELFEEVQYERKRLLPSESLRLIELSMEFEGVRRLDHIKDRLGNLFEELGHERKRLSPSESLKFIELFMEMEGNRRSDYVRSMITKLRKELKHKEKGLSPSESLRLIELFLGVEGNMEEVQNMLKDLFEELKSKGTRLLPSESLRLIELSMEVEDDKILEDIKNLFNNLKDQIRSLSPSESLRLIEISISFKEDGNLRYAKAIWESLPRYLKSGDGNISKKIKKLKNLSNI